MRPRSVLYLAGYLTLTVVASITAAQAPAEPGLVPVDQGVGDLDRLSTSLRHVETGLRTDGQQTSLFRVVPPGNDPELNGLSPLFYRVTPGVVARVNRVDYLVPISDRELGLNAQPRIDGQFIELIPADTVFDLSTQPGPLLVKRAGHDADRPAVVESSASRESPVPSGPGAAAVSPTRPASPSDTTDYRLDLRLNTRIDGRVGAPGGPAHGTQGPVIPRDRNTGLLFRHQRVDADPDGDPGNGDGPNPNRETETETKSAPPSGDQ